MIDVVSLKFKGRSKIYYFDPAGTEVKPGQQVVVETSKGLELCECVQGNHTVTDERIVPPLRPVVRIATEDDLRIAELCKVREKEAFGICEKKIADHGLEMKLVDVECAFDGSKI
ncbi:MAG: PSP1 domain-containing protein, partial [Oscillospiraceae bacterium]|nr:PSP1 domain-containing protein [Oscillospiraceae bacterium]